MATKEQSGTVSVDEAARRLGIGRKLAYVAVHDGSLPVIKLGSRMRVPTNALNELLAGKRR